MREVEEALASIQADHEWAHGVLTDEIERLRNSVEQSREAIAHLEAHRNEDGKKIAQLRLQAERSRKLATERGQLLSECARLIPIALPLPERIRFVLEMKDNLAKENAGLIERVLTIIKTRKRCEHIPGRGLPDGRVHTITALSDIDNQVRALDKVCKPTEGEPKCDT